MCLLPRKRPVSQVRNVEIGVWSVDCGVEVRNVRAECGARDVEECGLWVVDCGELKGQCCFLFGFVLFALSIVKKRSHIYHHLSTCPLMVVEFESMRVCSCTFKFDRAADFQSELVRKRRVGRRHRNPASRICCLPPLFPPFYNRSLLCCARAAFRAGHRAI